MRVYLTEQLVGVFNIEQSGLILVVELGEEIIKAWNKTCRVQLAKNSLVVCYRAQVGSACEATGHS